MITEIEVEGIGTLRHLNNWQLHRLRNIHGPNRFVAPMAFGLGMTIPQFKKLSDDERQAVIAAFSKLMAPEANGLVAVREVRPQLPDKGQHVPIARQVELGQKLIAMKAQLPRGHFRRWVEDESGISWSQASRFIKLANAKAREGAQREQGQSRTIEPETLDDRQRTNLGRAA